MFSKRTPFANSTSTPEQLLTPQNCISASKIKTFLRLSRVATDDNIQQHLEEESNCHEYFRTKVVPQWQNRSEVIEFCDEYSQTLRQQTHLKDQETKAGELDLRTDPYAMRDFNSEIQKQYDLSDSIRIWVRNEQNVEQLIRDQTVQTLVDKCGDYDWMGEFKKSTLRAKSYR